MEYQETINTWKEYPHVLTMLTRDNYNVPQGKTFMQKFLEGAYSYVASCLGSLLQFSGSTRTCCELRPLWNKSSAFNPQDLH